jgi:hypothetical protein
MFYTPASGPRQMSHDSATVRRSKDRSRVAMIVLITLLLAPVVLTIVAGLTLNQRNGPSDQDLLENLLAHEAQFNELVAMLTSDCRSVPPGAGESIDLAGVSAVVTNAARKDTYERLLREISVTDLRYFPGSGRLVLMPAAAGKNIRGSSKSYVYTADGQPQPAVAQYGYHSRAPGLYFLTGDRRVKGSWFIHYDTVIRLGVSPY